MKTTELSVKISECHVMEDLNRSPAMSEVTACCMSEGEVGYHLNAFYLFSFRIFLVRIIDLVQPRSTSIWYLGSGFDFISLDYLYLQISLILLLKKKSKQGIFKLEFWKTVTKYTVFYCC